MKTLYEKIMESLQEPIEKSIKKYGEDSKRAFQAVKAFSESQIGEEKLDLSQIDASNYTICKDKKLEGYSTTYYKTCSNLSAVQICMLISVYFENDLFYSMYEARTSFVEKGKKMSEMEWFNDALLVFDCQNNDNAQYLEKCLAAIGIWTSKGSGRQSEDNSKYVYVTMKSKEELDFCEAVNSECYEKLSTEPINEFLTNSKY